MIVGRCPSLKLSFAQSVPLSIVIQMCPSGPFKLPLIILISTIKTNHNGLEWLFNDLNNFFINWKWYFVVQVETKWYFINLLTNGTFCTNDNLIPNENSMIVLKCHLGHFWFPAVVKWHIIVHVRLVLFSINKSLQIVRPWVSFTPRIIFAVVEEVMLQNHRILHSPSSSHFFLAHITCAGRAEILLSISLEGGRHSLKLCSIEVMLEDDQVGFALVSSFAW